MKSLPTGWAVAPIRTLMQPLPDGKLVHQGWSPQCEAGPARLDSDWGALKTTAIQDGAYFPEHNKRLPDTLEAKQRLEVQVGDLLMTCAGPRIRCGVACLVRATPSRRFISGKMYRFRANDALIDSRLLEAFIRRPETKALIDAMKTGISESGMNITHEKFSQLVVPVAPRPEQKRIADKLDTVLTCVDAVNERLARVAPLLKRFRQSVLAAATSGRLTEDWRILNGHLQPWREVRLSDIAEVQGGVTKDAKKQSLVDEEIPYLRVANVQRGYLDLGEIKTIRVPQAKLPGLLLCPGDILFNEGGDLDKLGRGWIWEGQIERCSFQNHVFRARLRDQSCEPKYISWWGNYRGLSYFIGAGKQTTNLASINRTVLCALPISIPPKEEQTEIVRRVEILFAFADRLEARLQAAQIASDRLTPSLLAKAFRGELVPQDPNDEPASELLKRLAAAPATLTRKRGSKTTS